MYGKNHLLLFVLLLNINVIFCNNQQYTNPSKNISEAIFNEVLFSEKFGFLDEALSPSMPFMQRSKDVNALGLIPVGLYLPDLDNDTLSQECYRDIKIISDILQLTNTKAGTFTTFPWLARLVDSWGKAADGFLWGNSKLYGFFEECLSVQPNHDNKLKFEGQYCLLTSGQKNKTKSVIMYKPTADISYGTCIPSTCSQEELVSSVNSHLDKVGKVIKKSHCQIKNQTNMDSEEIFGIVFFSILGTILLVSTVLDIFAQSSYGKSYYIGKTYLVFSLWSNIPKIFGIKENYKDKRIITCVHGIRSLSLFWVIWGHQFLYSLPFSVNFLSITKLSSNILAQTVFNADKSVDSFFMLGGLFVTIGILSQMEKRGRFNPLYYYIHRLVRIWPGYAIAVCFTATITTLLASGPNKELYREQIIYGCRKGWFYELLFMSNFMSESSIKNTISGDFNGQMCVGPSWYLGADFQIYLIMPLIILPLFYNKKIGLALLAVWTSVSLAVPGIIIGVKDLWGAGTMSFNQKDFEMANRMVYLTPWCRIQAYLVGVWAGYILHWNNDKSFKLPKIGVAIGWCVSIGLMLSVLYGLYRYNQYYDGVPDMSLGETIAYNIFQRALWALGLAWIVIACHWGYGGFLNDFLSHPCWQPISRLSYSMFLLALPIQILIVFNRITPLYITHWNTFSRAFAIQILVLPLGVILSLISESPILNLEKIILSPSRSVSNQEEPRGELNANFSED